MDRHGVGEHRSACHFAEVRHVIETIVVHPAAAQGPSHAEQTPTTAAASAAAAPASDTPASGAAPVSDVVTPVSGVAPVSDATHDGS